MTFLAIRPTLAAFFFTFFVAIITGGTEARAEAPAPASVTLRDAGAGAGAPAEERVFTRREVRWLKVPGAILAVSGAFMFAVPSFVNFSDGADQSFDSAFIATGAVALSAGVVLMGFGIWREVARRPNASAAAPLHLEVSLGTSARNLGPSLRLAF